MPVPSEYRFASPLIVRLMGVVLVAVGLLVVLLAAAVALVGLPVVTLTVGVVVALVAVLGTGLVMTRRAVVVRLGEQGYEVQYVRGAGVRQAFWTEVEDVVASTVEGQRCVQVRLRDGRSTTIPVDVLATDPNDFVHDLQQHLDRGHGYRKLG